MKKILVTTDFSDNSKPGLLFAIQMASQNDYELTFFHTYHTLVPTAWNQVRIEGYEKDEAIKIEEKLNAFVEQTYLEIDISVAHYKCVIKSSVFADSCIREYAAENDFDFICISTRGAGTFKRLLGTNTANLINNSEVPVIAIPHNYEKHAIDSILYLSDLLHFEKEILKVIAFAEPLKASVELLHLSSAFDKKSELELVEKSIKGIAAYDVKFETTVRNPDVGLVADIEEVVKNIQPSVMIMFTEQNRTWFDKIFISSKSAEYSFNAKVPLLVFHKS